MAEIVLRHVGKRFDEIEAVHDLSLTIGDGEFVVLLGPTGAGKTTTLRLVAGLEYADEGTISIGARDVTRSPPAARNVAFVFQQYSLYPHLSVYARQRFVFPSPRFESASRKSRHCCISKASLVIAPRGFPAVRCSVSRSDVRWSGNPPFILWMSRSPRSTPSSAPNSALS